MSGPFFPENLVIIPAITARTGAGAAINGTAVSLKYAQMLWAVVDISTPGTSAAVAIVPQTDALVAFGSGAVLTSAVPIWVNADIATGAQDLVEATAAVNYTTVADALAKQVIFQIDPALLTAGELCFRIRITTLAATDFISCNYLIQPRYGGPVADQPNYLID
jgi:hypothetical protein